MNRIGVEKPSPLGTRDPGGRRPHTRHPGTPSRGPRLSQGSRRRATKFRQPPGLALSGCQLLPYRVRTRLPRNPENQNATRSRSQAYFICSRISAHCAGWRGARPRVFPTPKTTGCVLLAITDDQHPPRIKSEASARTVTRHGLSRPERPRAARAPSRRRRPTMPCIAGITLHGYTQSTSRGRRDPRRAQRTTTSSTTLRAHRTAPT